MINSDDRHILHPKLFYYMCELKLNIILMAICESVFPSSQFCFIELLFYQRLVNDYYNCASTRADMHYIDLFICYYK